MKSVLIVDDEYYIRVRVRKCVDWQVLGFGVVVDCGSGREALALMEQQPFDLAVLDISMPVMDGLAVCREMQKRGHAAQIIVLTGYDKFEYAKTALSYGVVDYILKPVDGDEMERAVRKASDRIEQNASIERHMRKSEELELQAKRMDADLFVASVLSDGYPASSKTAARLRSYGMDPAKNYRVAYLADDLPLAQFVPLRDTGLDALDVRLSQGRVWIVEEDGDAVFRPGGMEWIPPVNIGVSTTHLGTPSELHMAYREARLMFCQRILAASPSVFCYGEEFVGRARTEMEPLKTHLESFGAALRAQNLREMESSLSRAFAVMTRERHCVVTLYVFLERLLRDIQRNDPGLGDTWDGSVLFEMQTLEMLKGSDTLDDVMRQVVDIAAQSISRNPLASSSAGSLLVKRVKQLVDDHYMDAELSLSIIARTLSLNASYLSDSFRRFASQTLSQYIAQVRMEKARELLSGGDISLAELMEQVGYKDPYYFSKRFKKHFGCSPSAYRTKHRRQQL